MQQFLKPASGLARAWVVSAEPLRGAADYDGRRVGWHLFRTDRESLERLQWNGHSQAKRVLYLGYAIGMRNELQDVRLRRFGTNEHVIGDVSSGFAFGPELGLHLYLHANDFDRLLRCLSIKIVGIARRQCETQHFTSVCTGAEAGGLGRNLEVVGVGPGLQGDVLALELAV